MDIFEIENVIERVNDNTEVIKSALKSTALYSYYHHGTEFTYVHAVDANSNKIRILVDGKLILDVDNISHNMEYLNSDEVINHPFDIGEDLHFQLSTQKALISYEHIQMVKKISDLLK
ncbi:hypothetical protein GAP32_383 [Cronobacter phage vB_CsaM_GAP32]|uniref:Uncharacterized protein n=1 Tax=Cronobacter phage vB_CsaM_GAP32 TaxID=1141136 RepID=K4F9N8_9CAUD|nr:hypothetical protein GAP32_383 [Cronobacter phage vB_CsaM_GAP32]AFC21835.1 hypothetical protein GAP32_383 [Cronobacter phage vB_CsaM_GAP32]